VNDTSEEENQMSYKYGMIVDGKPSFNTVVLATHEEADDAARELMSRWFAPITGWEVVETTDAVNYTFDWDNGLQSLGGK
jgi:hypothetical protein